MSDLARYEQASKRPKLRREAEPRDGDESSEGETDDEAQTDDDGDTYVADDEEDEELPPSTGHYTLTPAQRVVADAMVRCCQTYGRFVNESGAGTGKTPTTVVAAARLGKPLVVVGLAAVTGMRTVWRTHTHNQGVQLVDYIGWEALRGSRSPEQDTRAVAGRSFQVQMKHRFLSRTDTWTGGYKTVVVDGVETRVKEFETEYKVTPAWTALVSRGVTLVADEIQRAKNRSLTNKAFTTLANVLTIPDKLLPGVSGSSLVLLSATTIDRMSNAPNILRVLNISHDAAMALCQPAVRSLLRYMGEKSYYFQRGTGLLVSRERYLTDKTNHVHKRFNKKKNNTRHNVICFGLYSMCVRDLIAEGVVNPTEVAGVTLEYRNVRYPLADQSGYTAALRNLRSHPHDHRALARVEACKFATFVEQTVKALTEPGRKVLVFLNTRDAVAAVSAGIRSAGYRVRVIQGGVTDDARKRYMAEFNEPTDKLRCIVGIITTMSEGLSFHDTTGNWPRTTFISPTPIADKMAQAMYRTNRYGVKGLVRVYLVFGEGEGNYNEENLLKSIVETSAVMASVAHAQRKSGVLLPADLKTYTVSASGEMDRLVEIDHTPRMLKVEYAYSIRKKRELRLAGIVEDESLSYTLGQLMGYYVWKLTNVTEAAMTTVSRHLQDNPDAMRELQMCDEWLVQPGGPYSNQLRAQFLIARSRPGAALPALHVPRTAAAAMPARPMVLPGPRPLVRPHVVAAVAAPARPLPLPIDVALTVTAMTEDPSSPAYFDKLVVCLLDFYKHGTIKPQTVYEIDDYPEVNAHLARIATWDNARLAAFKRRM